MRWSTAIYCPSPGSLVSTPQWATVSPATQAELYLPSGIALDGAGNLYIADSLHNRIRMVCASATSATIQGTSCAGAGIITTIAGSGNPSYTGDGGPAASATLSGPGDVAFDGAGNLYIADSGNNAIRMITAATGVITTIAGNAGGTPCGSASDAVGDGCPATQATLNLPEGVTLDASANVYIADTNNHRIREVSAATGVISTIAGSGFTNPNGTGGYNGDGIAATSAKLNFPYAVAFDAAGNMYIPDSANQRVREVMAVGGVIAPSSTIPTLAGTGNAGATPCTATPVAANQADVWSPSGVAVDAAGNVYIAESQNAAIRKVSAVTGLISTLAENGCGDFYAGGHVSYQCSFMGRSASISMAAAISTLPTRSIWWCAKFRATLPRSTTPRPFARAAHRQPRTRPSKTTAMPRST